MLQENISDLQEARAKEIIKLQGRHLDESTVSASYSSKYNSRQPIHKKQELPSELESNYGKMKHREIQSQSRSASSDQEAATQIAFNQRSENMPTGGQTPQDHELVNTNQVQADMQYLMQQRMAPGQIEHNGQAWSFRQEGQATDSMAVIDILNDTNRIDKLSRPSNGRILSNDTGLQSQKIEDFHQQHHFQNHISDESSKNLNLPFSVSTTNGPDSHIKNKTHSARGQIETNDTQITGTLGGTFPQINFGDGVSKDTGEHSKSASYSIDQHRKMKALNNCNETTSFREMQTDIQRLQDKIKGLESRLQPSTSLTIESMTQSEAPPASGMNSDLKFTHSSQPGTVSPSMNYTNYSIATSQNPQKYSTDQQIEAASSLLQKKMAARGFQQPQNEHSQSVVQHPSASSSPESSFLSPDMSMQQPMPLTETSQYKIEHSINEFMNYGQKMTTFGDDPLDTFHTHNYRPSTVQQIGSGKDINKNDMSYTTQSQHQLKTFDQKQLFDQRNLSPMPTNERSQSGLRTSRSKHSAHQKMNKIRIPSQKRKEHLDHSRTSSVARRQRNHSRKGSTRRSHSHRSVGSRKHPKPRNYNSAISQKSGTSVYSNYKSRDRSFAFSDDKSESTQDLNLKKTNQRLKQKLEITTLQNKDLLNEIDRLRKRLKDQEGIKDKYKFLKMNYTKVLSQLEKLEMARRNEKEQLKYMTTKINKLKSDKRHLKEELAKNFGNSSARLNFKKKYNKDDVLLQINKPPKHKNIKNSKSTSNLKKRSESKKYQSKKSNRSSVDLRKADEDANRKMINIQNLHYGLRSRQVAPKEKSRSNPRYYERSSSPHQQHDHHSQDRSQNIQILNTSQYSVPSSTFQSYSYMQNYSNTPKMIDQMDQQFESTQIQHKSYYPAKQQHDFRGSIVDLPIQNTNSNHKTPFSPESIIDETNIFDRKYLDFSKETLGAEQLSSR